MPRDSSSYEMQDQDQDTVHLDASVGGFKVLDLSLGIDFIVFMVIY